MCQTANNQQISTLAGNQGRFMRRKNRQSNYILCNKQLSRERRLLVQTDARKNRHYGERPYSTKKVRCLDNVEAFILKAEDVGEVTKRFSRFMRSPRVKRAIRASHPLLVEVGFVLDMCGNRFVLLDQMLLSYFQLIMLLDKRIMQNDICSGISSGLFLSC